MQFIEDPPVIEKKFQAFASDTVHEENRFSGYAARFGEPDSSGDVIHPMAFERLKKSETMPKLLWQHDPLCPIGVWEEAYTDTVGLLVTGMLLTQITLAQEAAVLVKAGVVDGLSIGYRVVRSEQIKTASGNGRHLLDLDVVEISLVTFPMASKARVVQAPISTKQDENAVLAHAFDQARSIINS